MDNSGATRRRTRIAATVGTAVLVATAAGYAWPRHSPPARHEAGPPLQPAATFTPPAPAAAPVAAPVARPVDAPPHQYVAPAAPTSFTLTGRAFTIKAHVCGMPNVRPLDPPGEQHHTVCWVNEGFGVAPGSNTATTYVLGHSWAQDGLEVLNKVSEAATREVLHAEPRKLSGVPTFPARSMNGYRLVLRTRTGTLTYRVRDAYGVDKLQLGKVGATMNERVRHRIVLITCAELQGVDHPYNIVVNAYLYSSVSRTANTANTANTAKI